MNFLFVPTKNTILTVFLLFSFLEIHCQHLIQIKFDNISVRDGLSQTTPNCIMQDSRGFLWIGTEDGLNKYDGYEFEVFKQDINNPFAISSSKIKCIEEDEEGNIWIGTNGGGLNRYDRKKNIFSNFKTNDKDSFSVSGNIINCIRKDGNGKLWIGTNNGLSVLDIRTKIFKDLISGPDRKAVFENIEINDIISGTDNIIWIATGNGLARLDTADKQVSFYRNNPSDPASIPDNAVTCLLTDRKGNLWVGTKSGLVKKEPGTDNFKRLNRQAALSLFEIKDLLEDENGNIWVATFGGGLDIYMPEKNEVISNTLDYNNPNSIGHNEVSCLFKDRSGIIWAGTYGLDKYNPKKEKFRLYDYLPKENISFKSIYAIYQDRLGVLWVGSKLDGVHVLDRSNNGYFRIRHEANNPNSLSSNKVRVIKENPDGVIWVGTDDGGLNKIMLDNNRKPYKYIVYRHNPKDVNSLTSDLIYSLYFDGEGYLWIGTDKGLNRMHLETETFKRYTPDEKNQNSLNNNTAYYIYGDNEGVMWVATDYGINRYNPKTDGFIHYVHDDKNENSVIINEILTFYEDRNGMLWIGTFSGGLDKFDRKASKFIHFSNIKELSNAVIYGIFEDNNANLWMSTNNGIIQFNPKTLFLKQYTIEDGLQSSEFNGGAYYKGINDEIFFGGYFGFNSFFPDRIKLDTITPQIVLTDLQVKNIPVQPGNKSPIKEHITEADEIILNHKQNNFTIFFAALHFANPSQNKYRYKLEGYDKQWIESGTRRYASYTSLPYKKYRFRVQASNSDGIWNEKGISVKIRIKPPLVSTFWFRLFIVAAVSFLIFYGIRYRINAEHKQKLLLEERVKESTRELELAKEKLDKQKEEIILQKQELKFRERDQQELLWFNQGIGLFSDIFSRPKDDISQFSGLVINKLVEYVEAQQGGVFLLNDDDENDIFLELVAHYAYNIERLNTRFIPGEGYIGTCFKEKGFIEINDLPPGYAIMRSGLGQEQLRFLLLFPLKVNESVIGVIEIASYKKIKGYKIAFIEKICETFASVIGSIKSNNKLRRLIDKANKQALELQEREEELRQNIEEMQATQEEAARREDELIRYAEEAASREEMLNQRIEELESQLKEIKSKKSAKKG